MKPKRTRPKPKTPDSILKFYGNCAVTGKRRYVDRKEAKKHIKHIASHGNSTPGELQVYKCVHCEDFHVGHHFGLDRETHRLIALGDTIRHDSEAQN